MHTRARMHACAPTRASKNNETSFSLKEHKHHTHTHTHTRTQHVEPYNPRHNTDVTMTCKRTYTPSETHEKTHNPYDFQIRNATPGTNKNIDRPEQTKQQNQQYQHRSRAQCQRYFTRNEVRAPQHAAMTKRQHINKHLYRRKSTPLEVTWAYGHT